MPYKIICFEAEGERGLALFEELYDDYGGALSHTRPHWWQWWKTQSVHYWAFLTRNHDDIRLDVQSRAASMGVKVQERTPQ